MPGGSETAGPYNPKSNRPAEYLGDWADEAAEKDAREANGAIEKLNAVDDQVILERVGRWDSLGPNEKLTVAVWMLDHPEYISGSGHTEEEYRMLRENIF